MTSPYTVSVIVPFLNAETTIARCVDSILSQDLDSFEVVMIDDGSTDNSITQLQLAINRQPRMAPHIKLLQNPTPKGVGAAHQMGVDHSSGRFVIRVDSDDELLPGALAAMVDKARTSGADIVYGWFLRNDGRSDTVAKPHRNFPNLNSIPPVVENFSLCNKIISRNLLTDNNIRVIPGVDCWDDLTVVSRALALSPLTASVDRPVYRYYVEPGRKSMSRESRDMQLQQHLLAAKELDSWFINNHLDERYRPFLNSLKLIAKVKYLRGRGKNIAAWKRTFPEINRHILGISTVPLHFRIMMQAVALLPTPLTQTIADIIDKLSK